MDNKKSFSRFVRLFVTFLVLIITVAASAGCINFGLSSHEPFYIVVGIINLGWLFPCINYAIKSTE